MTTLFISSLVLLAGILLSAVYLIRGAYIHTIDGLRADNKDLRDRLFQSKALPPSGIDLTEKYEARQETQRQQREENSQKKVPRGPLEQLEARWAEDDRYKAGRNIDATQLRRLN